MLQEGCVITKSSTKPWELPTFLRHFHEVGNRESAMARGDDKCNH